MVVLSLGIVAGVLIPGEDPISPVLDARATAHLAEVCVIVSLMGVGLPRRLARSRIRQGTESRRPRTLAAPVGHPACVTWCLAMRSWC
jgi:hypothetical protein